MSAIKETDEKIRTLWQAVWSDPVHAQSAIAPDRYAIEAYRRMRPFFGAGNHARQILEVGCGTGRFCRMLAEEFPTSTILGVDVAEKSVALARNAAAGATHANVSFARASAFSLPFAENAFDVVFSQGVISLFDRATDSSDFAAVREMVRVTRRGGGVLLSVVNWRCWPHTFYKWRLKRKGLPYEYGYEKSYTRRELAALLHLGGLVDLQFAGFFPSYGFHRLSNRVRHFSRALRLMGRLVDRFDGPRLSAAFGFEVVAFGRKPLAGAGSR